MAFLFEWKLVRVSFLCHMQILPAFTIYHATTIKTRAELILLQVALVFTCDHIVFEWIELIVT